MNDVSTPIFNDLSLTTSATIQGGLWAYHPVTRKPGDSAIASSVTLSTHQSDVGQTIHSLAPIVTEPLSEASQHLPSSLTHAYHYGYHGPLPTRLHRPLN